MGPHLKLLLRSIKWTTGVIMLLFIVINALWQYQYEHAIADARKQCPAFHARKRVKHTPVLFVLIRMHRDRAEMLKNRYCSKILFNECPGHLNTGLINAYVAHCYFTAQQKDSIIDVNGMRDVLENGYQHRGK